MKNLLKDLFEFIWDGMKDLFEFILPGIIILFSYILGVYIFHKFIVVNPESNWYVSLCWGIGVIPFGILAFLWIEDQMKSLAKFLMKK